MNSRQIFQMILSRTVFRKAKTQVAVVARGLLHPQHVLGADTDSGQLRSEILTSYRLKEPENNSCMRASVAFPPQSGVPGPVGWLGSPTGDSSGYVQPTDNRPVPVASSRQQPLFSEQRKPFKARAPLRPDRAPSAH